MLEKFYALQRDFSNLTYSFQHSVGPSIPSPRSDARVPRVPQITRSCLVGYPPGPNTHARTHGGLTGVAPSQAEGVHRKAQATGRRAARTNGQYNIISNLTMADVAQASSRPERYSPPHPAGRARRGCSTADLRIDRHTRTWQLSGMLSRPIPCVLSTLGPVSFAAVLLGVLRKLRPSTFSGLGPAAPQQQSKSVHLRGWSKTAAALSGRSADCIAIIPQSYRG